MALHLILATLWLLLTMLYIAQEAGYFWLAGKPQGRPGLGSTGYRVRQTWPNMRWPIYVTLKKQ